MGDDLVKQSIAELQDLVRCRCHEAYRGRGMHDPDCHCDTAEAVKVVADRIKALTAERDAALLREKALKDSNQEARDYLKERDDLKAKLARALTIFDNIVIALDPEEGEINRLYALQDLRRVLAELKGEK